MTDDTRAVVVADRQSVLPYNTPLKLRTLDEYLTLGEVLWKSGYFSDVKSASQAVAKMLAGAELGFGPFVSMSGVYIQGGRPSFMANLIAASVDKHGYSYTVDKLDNTECQLTFHGRDGKVLGTSRFTMEDAETAGLKSGSNAHSWKKFPRNMLFSRAMSNGARWYTPEIFGGATPYTPDELDAVIDGETGEVLVPASPNGTHPPQPEPVKPTPTAPTTTPAPEPTRSASQMLHVPEQPAPDKVMAVASVTELDEHFACSKLTENTVMIWNGTEWQKRPADEHIKVASGSWFTSHFVGKDKAFETTYALFGTQQKNPDGTDKNVGHLGKHYGRRNFVNPKDPNDALTYREYAELVAYAWYKQGDTTHGRLATPRYQDKVDEEKKRLKKELDEQPPIPYEGEPAGVPTSYDVVSERAKKLGVDIVSLAQAAFGVQTALVERHLTTLWQVLDAVELGNVKADDFDGQLEMIMLN